MVCPRHRTGVVLTNASGLVVDAKARPQGQTGPRRFDFALFHLTKSGGKFSYQHGSGLSGMLGFYREILLPNADPALPLTAMTIIRNPADRTRWEPPPPSLASLPLQAPIFLRHRVMHVPVCA